MERVSDWRRSRGAERGRRGRFGLCRRRRDSTERAGVPQTGRRLFGMRTPSPPSPFTHPPSISLSLSFSHLVSFTTCLVCLSLRLFAFSSPSVVSLVSLEFSLLSVQAPMVLGELASDSPCMTPRSAHRRLCTLRREGERDCTNTVSPCIIIQWRPESAEAAALAVREDVTRVSVLSLSLSLWLYSGSPPPSPPANSLRRQSVQLATNAFPRGTGRCRTRESSPSPPLHSTPRLFRAVKIIWGLCVKRYRGVLVKNLQNFN